MHSYVYRLLAACAILSTCATARSQEGGDVMKTVYNDCMVVMVIHFQNDKKITNPAVAANTFCQIAVNCLTKRPAADCKRGISSYDLKREGAGASALYEASRIGSASVVRRLIEFGFDPNAPLSGPGWTGWTPLMIATAENHEETVKLLLDGGGDPNAQNALGRTSLMFASAYGNAAIAAMLMDKGANPNVVPKDETGWTALMAAASKGHIRVVQILLERGADRSLRDKNGQTALDLAVTNKQSEAVRILNELEKTK